MPSPQIEIDDHGLFKRMQAFPAETAKVFPAGMDASLVILWENVPPYPPPPAGSTYKRTGTLGKSLGSSMGGGKTGGQPSIYSTKKIGAGYVGRFGSDLSYAPPVIGEGTQRANMSHWWTVTTIADKARDKIIKLWDKIGDKLAKFLDGKGV